MPIMKSSLDAMSQRSVVDAVVARNVIEKVAQVPSVPSVGVNVSVMPPSTMLQEKTSVALYWTGE